jgi:hypothetical protein
MLRRIQLHWKTVNTEFLQILNNTRRLAFIRAMLSVLAKQANRNIKRRNTKLTNISGFI